MPTDTKSPEVSVIMSTYNRANLLPRAIESVINQTFQDWELLVVDDCSTDNTQEVVKEWQEKDKRIKYIRLEKNHGNHTKPKNTGILASKGEYICYLDDDCEYFPNFIDVLKLELELSSVDVVYGDERMYKDEDDERGEPAISMEFSGQFLLHRSFIDTNVAFHKRDAVFDVGGWDEELPRFADWNLFVRMAKWGKSFKHVPVLVTKYYLTKGNSAEKYPVKTWQDEHTGMTMFDPTYFVPSSCYIYKPYLGDDKEEEKNPRVAIFTITMDRLDYTKKMWDSLTTSTKRHFDWFVADNGSSDGTADWLHSGWNVGQISGGKIFDKNKGLTFASNYLVDEIQKGDYEIIGKVDNDCLFLTKGWLEDMVDLWKRNHKVYMAPYPEGLVDHPGGAFRVGAATIGDEFVEVTKHLSGLCAFIDAKAYNNFRWSDKFLHGQQDGEASEAFLKQGYMPIIMPKHRVQHYMTTAGQHKDFPEYFERRKTEQTTQA